MYLKEYFPFYTTYANPLLYEGERMQDKEFNLMKSYYPGTVQHIQEKIEEEWGDTARPEPEEEEAGRQ